MSPETVTAQLTEVADALGEQPGLDSYLARGAGLPAARVGRIELAADLAAEVTGDVVRALRQAAGRELVPYDPGYAPTSGQAMVAALADVPELARLHDLVRRDDLTTDDPDHGPVLVMAHRIHRGDALAAVYRLKGPGIATRRARGLRPLLPRDGVYDRVRGEVLYYEPRFDALVGAGSVLVSARTTLEQRLHAPEQVRALAQRTWQRVTATVAIEGAQALGEACLSDPAMTAKLASLARTLDADPAYAALLTTDRLIAFLAANPQVGVDLVGEGAAQRLAYDPSPQRRYRIVKLLADDFLRSDLTQQRYEAASKQRLAPP